jgi:hypothetical protein
MAATKTRTVLYTLAETAINAVAVGAAYTLPTSTPSQTIQALVHIYLAYVATTAPLGQSIRLQGNMSASDESTWVDIAIISGGTTAAVTDTTAGAITGGSSTTVATTSAATIGARSKLIYLKDSTTVGEWKYATSQAGSVLTFQGAAAANHSSGISFYDQAMQFFLPVDVTGLLRLRVVVDNNAQATGPTVAVFAEVTTYQP